MTRYRPPFNGVRRVLTTSDDTSVEDLAADKFWLYMYTSCLFLSFLSTLIASNHMRKLGGDVFRSAVRFVTTSFLTCTSIHALAGGLFYAYLIATMDQWVDNIDRYAHDYQLDHANDSASGSGRYPDPPTLEQIMASSSSGFDSGVESLLMDDHKNDGAEAAYLSKLTHDYKYMPRTLTLLLSLENIFFVLGAYWIFLLTCELYQLAKTTHDRGQKRERRQIRMYASGAMAILLFFLTAGVIILILHSGYGVSYRFLNIFELSTIVVSVLYSVGALLKLRFMGRKNEHIHGMLMASPLYRRLKLMVWVCIVFTLPYSLLQLSLIGMNADAIDDIPDYLVGIVTTLYYLFGAAQALVMGGSQECCVRLLQPIIPAHLRNTPEWRALQCRSGSKSCIAPNGEVIEAPAVPIFVNTDIESSSALWAQAPQHVIDEAQRIHDDLLRSTLPKYRGYEITTAGDAFQLAFHSIEEAASYCLEVQLLLIQAKWPSELSGLVPSTKTERECKITMNPIFKGIRVRMGIHDTNVDEEGSIISQVHPVTGKNLYIGASEYIAREIGDVGFGGQIIISKRIATWLRNHADLVPTPFVMDYYGSHAFCALDLEVELYEITPKLIEGRRKVFRKRRAALSADGKQSFEVISTPTSHTTSTGSSGESNIEDSHTEFRAHQSPTEEERRMWASV